MDPPGRSAQLSSAACPALHRSLSSARGMRCIGANTCIFALCQLCINQERTFLQHLLAEKLCVAGGRGVGSTLPLLLTAVRWWGAARGVAAPISIPPASHSQVVLLSA